MLAQALKRWIALAVAATPVVALSQVALPTREAANESGPRLQLGGRASMDLIRLDYGRFSFPLRFANVLRGSETLEMEGRKLRSGIDYTIDYKAGVIYMLRPFRDGQAVRANYRYDFKAVQVGTFGPQNPNGQGTQGLKLEFNPQTSFYLGLGMTDRLKDGTVLTSNVYGTSNAFSFGGGSLSGLLMVGERIGSNSTSLFGDYGTGRRQTDQGKGIAILQKFASSAFGGTVNANYQELDRRFAGFDALKQNGKTDKEVNALRKERGLKRSSLSLQNVGGALNNFSSGFRTVGDASGSINWRNYGFNFGGASFGWDSQKIDSSFKRFKDLSEGDRALLQKEKGLDRQVFQAGYDFGGGALSYNAFELNNEQGDGISWRRIGFDAPWLKMSFNDQSIDEKFTQFKGLRKSYDPFKVEGADGSTALGFNPNQLKIEKGVSRSSFNAETGAVGGALKYSSSSITSGGKGFESEDYSVGGDKWKFEFVRRDVDAGFTRLNALSKKERDENIAAIANMYSPGAKVNRKDAKNFMKSAGLDRALWRLGYDFGGGYTLRADQLSVDGATDGLLSQSYTLAGPKYDFSYAAHNVGDGFDEIRNLMATEQSVVGKTRGLSKSDVSFGVQLDKASKLQFSQMQAGVGDAGAFRQAFGYATKGLDLRWSRRSVDSDFAAVGSLMDPEKKLLAGLAGFDQTNMIAKWQVNPAIKVDLNWSDADHMQTDERRLWRESMVSWKLDSDMTVSAFRSEQKYEDNFMSSIDRSYNRFLVQRDFGSYGLLSLMQEERQFDGEDDSSLDSLTQRVVYKTSLSNTTDVETSHSETRFENGERETSTTNTVSQELTDRVGVSVSDTKIRRDGDTPDTTKRDYGFWVDFGDDIRFSFGQARNLKRDGSATKNVKMGLTSGQFSGIDVKSLQYSNDAWDGKRYKTTGNINIKTVKPLSFGSLTELEMFYTADTLRDGGRWKKENRTMGFTGKLGNVGFGYGYRSETDPTGGRAIDRVFSFNSDTTGKSALRFELNYDLRTLPNNKEVAIREFKFVAQPFRNWSVESSMITNPLDNRKKQGKFLGFVAKDTRINSWEIKYTGSSTVGSFIYTEKRNDRTKLLQRQVGLNLTLFTSSGSPLKLSYLTNLNDLNGTRQARHEFWLRFEQMPGPNQTLGLSMGNKNWQFGRPDGSLLQNWSARVDYGIRF